MAARSLLLAFLIILIAGSIAYALYNSTALAPISPTPTNTTVTVSPTAEPVLPDSSPMPSGTLSATPNASGLLVSTPKAGAQVSSPLTITGQATGSWYFEGSLPVELVDTNGNSLATGTAMAQGDWMTTELVPFTVTLTFTKPTTQTGTLILKKDNPSGLPENDAEQRVNVRF